MIKLPRQSALDEQVRLVWDFGKLTRFEHGTIYEHNNGDYETAGAGGTGCFALYGDIYSRYENDFGGTGSTKLGFPISDVKTATTSPSPYNTSGDYAKFEGGYMYTSSLNTFGYGGIFGPIYENKSSFPDGNKGTGLFSGIS